MTAVILGRCGEPTALELPLFSERVSAGFPSPAQDYIERSLDLNELCIKRPAATFFVRAEGEFMIEAGLLGDTLVGYALEAANHSYSPIELQNESELEIFGVVTNVIHSLR